jgi:cytochrome oxidase Cu insertion factor (SCO1/SenC/PrrC family)
MMGLRKSVDRCVHPIRGVSDTRRMKRLFSLLTLPVSIALLVTITGNDLAAPGKAARPSPAVGQAAPPFALLDQNGAKADLAAARGKKVVIVFYRGYW